MVTKVYIDGVDRYPDHVLDGSIKIDRTVGARAVATLTVCDRSDPPTYWPDIFEEVLIVDDEQSGTGTFTGDVTARNVTLSAGSFAVGDVGKILAIPGAGPTGTTLHAKIEEVINSSTVRTNRFPYVAVTNVPVTWGWRRFFGIIHSVSDSAMVDDVGLLTPITCQDFGGVLDRVLITMDFAAGQTARQVLDQVAVAYWDANGLFNDPDMSTGGDPLPELSFKRATGLEVLDQICKVNEFVYSVGFDGVLRVGAPGMESTPVALDTSNSTVRLGASGERSLGKYANRVIVQYGSGSQEVSETLSGDGSTREFPLTYTPEQRPGQVYDNQTATFKNVGVHGVDTLFEWTYRASDNAMVQLADAPSGTSNAALAIGESVSVTFMGKFPAVAVSQDAAEIAAHGNFDMIVDKPDIFNAVTAQAIADGTKSRYARTPKRINAVTYEHNFAPGQRGPITSVVPATSGNHLVESVSAVKLADVPGTWEYSISALQGDTPVDPWMDFYRQGSGAAGGGGSVTVGTPPPSSGTTGLAPISATFGGFDETARWFAPSASTWFRAPNSLHIPLNGSKVGPSVNVQIHLVVDNASLTIRPRVVRVDTSAQQGIGTTDNQTTLTHQSFAVATAPDYRYFELQFFCNRTDIGFGYAYTTVDNQ